MIFETNRLVLRAWRLSDADDLFAYAGGPNVGPLACWKPHADREESLRTIRFLMDDPLSWAIGLKATGRVIGQLRLVPDEHRGVFSSRKSAWLISYALSEAYWNQGLMTEAVSRAVRYAFEELHAEVLTAFHLPENVGSQRVLEKCGFRYETTLPGTLRGPDGQPADAVCHAIWRPHERSDAHEPAD